MDGVRFNVTGAGVVRRRLAELEPKLRRKYMRQALTKAATPLLRRAKELVPKDEGKLKRSLRKKIRVNPKKTYGIVGAEYSIAPHQHLVERGTVARTHKSGKSTGVMPARPFMRPAWMATRRVVASILNRVLIAGIRTESNKEPTRR